VCFDLVPPDEMVKRYHQPHASAITYVQGDILNPDDLDRAAAGRGVTKIVHAAVFTAVRHDIERDRCRSIVDINVAGTANLLDLACRLSVDRFLYVSSGSVYGEGLDPHRVLHEEVTLYPRTLYASTKYVSELLTRRYGELHGFQTVSTRLSSPYGPMERVTGHRAVMSVFYQWTRNAVRGEAIRVGDRTAGRDYTYVADTAAGICTVLDAPSLPHDVYNVSGGPAVTLGQIIEALRQARPSLRVVDDPSYEVRNLLPDVARGPMEVSRLRADLGFKPRYDVVSGVREYLEWREKFSFRD
jgi:nucleoside-diphosphate-sugar epimerase